MRLRRYVGYTIRDIRIEKNFTQEEVANRSGLHRTYITDVERGHRNISIESFEKIAAALQTPLSVFFERCEEKRSQPLHLVNVSHTQNLRAPHPIEILIVEDDPNFVELSLHAFQMANVRNVIHVARDGTEALDCIFATGSYETRKSLPPPSLILLDLKLPKVDGLEVLSRIRSNESTKHIPVIVMTASQSAEDVSRCERLGVQQYLTKPISFGVFSGIAASIGLQWLLLENRKAGNF
ncbi:MAG: response regulator [Bacteroidota bacterium]